MPPPATAPLDPEDWVLDVLGPFISEGKKAAMERSLSLRTRYLTLVLEDVYQPHNAAAVIRTAECHGLQDLHAIESEKWFLPSKGVVMGATKWMDIHRYETVEGSPESPTRHCLSSLKDQGFQIVAFTLRTPSRSVHRLSLDQPLALCFGSEKPGLSEEAHELADVHAHLPLFGFTESYNLSVAAALALHVLTDRLHRSDRPWRLSEPDRLQLRADWYRAAVRESELHLKRARQERPWA